MHRYSGIPDLPPGLKPFTTIKFDSPTVTSVPLEHSKPTLGYCLDDGGTRLAYLTDTFGLPVETERFLNSWQPDVVVLDACHPASYATPRNHNTITQALDIITRLNPPRAYLTHISHELDAERLLKPMDLPLKVRIAQDGDTLDNWP